MEEFEERFHKLTSWGLTLRAATVPLLFQAFDLQIKLFHFSHRELDYLEKEFRESYDKYTNWEHDLELFLNDISSTPSTNPVWNLQAEKQTTRIAIQRDDLRALLHQIGLVLNSHKSQAVNHIAIQIAFVAFFVSIILGVISIYVAYISQPIILYPPR
jgi:hypothetical protein